MRKVFFVLILFMISVTALSAQEEMVSSFFKAESLQLHYNSVDELEKELKVFFQACGITWPDGSILKYNHKLCVLFVKNTETNQEKISKLFNEVRNKLHLVEIEVQFVEYDADAIEKLAVDGVVTVEGLTELWRQKKGKLLAAPKVVTHFGVEATVKGVVECIYPTDYKLECEPATNKTYVGTGMALKPADFETREVGTILSILPEWMPEKGLINVVMTPEYVKKPEWKKYDVVYECPKGTGKSFTVEQPFFNAFSYSTTMGVRPGKRVLIGGGVPDGTGKKVNYAFITARLLSADGSELKTDGLRKK